jgi:regulator of nonsense transcripts 2
MRHQQEAEKEEKKRLKNLVLNLDLRDDTDADGTGPLSYLLQPNPNVRPGRSLPRPASRWASPLFVPETVEQVLPSASTSSSARNHENRDTHNDVKGATVDRNLPNPYLQPRVDRAGKGRASQRGRQLQVSDLDWYSHPRSQTDDTQTLSTNTDERRRGRGPRGARGHGRRP